MSDPERNKQTDRHAVNEGSTIKAGEQVERRTGNGNGHSTPYDYVYDKGATNVLVKLNEDVGDDKEDTDDPWTVSEVAVKSVPWNDLSKGDKAKRIVWNYFLRQALLIGLLYLFICSLDFLSSAFRLVAGKQAAAAFRSSEIVNNPVAGLMMGVVATVLLQSSSTTTSIIVSMVGSELLEVKAAIPIVMGANIGTSVTNTIVSIGQSGDRNQFRRAFGGATVHDMFNWLSVLILLPLEIASGYLSHLSHAIVESFNLQTNDDHNVKLLKALTEPFTKFVIQIDKKALIAIAKNESVSTLTKQYCSKKLVGNETVKMPCEYLFKDIAGVWKDWVLGLILLFISLFILCSCLVLIVKILNSIFKGSIAVILKKFVNADMPGKCGKVTTGYVAIMIGALLTMLVQSSSIFTSTLTPLVGIGVITIERVFPLTLGANIGTTFTAILSSLAQESDTLKKSIQISMCHLFFNISGILIWYPLPFMRKVPIFLAKKLGDTTAKYRWFAVLYLIVCFFLVPGAMFGLSYAGNTVFFTVLGASIITLLTIVIVNILQVKKPEFLPKKLRNWDFLPLVLHSLRPYDSILSWFLQVCMCCKRVGNLSHSDDSKALQKSEDSSRV